MCNEKGGIIDDLTIYKFNGKKFMLVVNASNEIPDFEWCKKIAKHEKFHVKVTNSSREFAKLDIQGPNSKKILQQITDFDLNELSFYTFKEGNLIGFPGIISQSGYTGELGYEIYFPWNAASEVWDKLLELGKEDGIKPIGLGARDTLRLECAMNLYGHEMDENKTPLEARYAWVCDFEKDFIGKEAILAQKEKGVPSKLVGFEMVDRGIARNPYKVFKNGEEIGYVTSGTMSPTLKKALGLSYIKSEHASVGEEIEIQIRDKLCMAKIVKLPFYKKTDGV